jgi:hypothetical protein
MLFYRSNRLDERTEGDMGKPRFQGSSIRCMSDVKVVSKLAGDCTE